MEPHEHEILRKNRPQLLELIECTETLLAGLEHEGILSKADSQSIVIYYTC